MDCFVGKRKTDQCEKDHRRLAEKVRLLQEEIKAIICVRERERNAHDGDMIVFAFKEAEWKQETKKLKEEVMRLGKMVEEKEERIRGMEDRVVMVGEKSAREQSPLLGTGSSFLLVEQMREERVRRDVAVDKWKKLYLAIKTELDDLIQRTHRDWPHWKAEDARERMIEDLKEKLKAKEEKIEEMKARLVSVECEERKRAREVDILRQSLRIMGSRKASSFALNKPKLSSLVKGR